MQYKQSLYWLRKVIGILGLALPPLLIFNHSQLLSSMSHYYYSSGGVFFIAILFAFGLILITYRGYPQKKNEWISDNLVTTLAGVCIFVAVLIPTQSKGSLGCLSFTDSPYLFGYKSNGLLNTIHLLSAGLFLILLGYMCIFKFVLNRAAHGRNRLFRSCGFTIWGSVAALVLIIAYEKLFGDDFNETIPAYVLWLEWVAVYAFAIAWLVKGRIKEDVMRMFGSSNVKKFLVGIFKISGPKPKSPSRQIALILCVQTENTEISTIEQYVTKEYGHQNVTFNHFQFLTQAEIESFNNRDS